MADETTLESFREEERQFRKGLLSELERHNALLREILDRLGKSQICLQVLLTGASIGEKILQSRHRFITNPSHRRCHDRNE